jgi:hypothetical protein
MDRTERYFKIVFDAVITLLFYFILIQWFLFIPSIVLSWVLAHTANFIFNGQVFGVLKCFGYIKHQAFEIEDNTLSMKFRIQGEPSLRWAAVYGSISRGELKVTSDLDVRLIRYSGLINGLRACFFVMRERTRAHIQRFPLDILLLDGPRLLERISPDEPPVVIFDASVEKIKI